MIEDMKNNELLSMVSCVFDDNYNYYIGANSTHILLSNITDKKPYTISIATRSIDGYGDESLPIRIYSSKLSNTTSSSITIISYKEGILIGAFITFLGFIVCSCILCSRKRFVTQLLTYD
jgi:hypothetical protein